jgi:hypothetical protein
MQNYAQQYGGRGARFVADDKNDQPLGSQMIGAANGKDVLYGWLVGRAAADLGLAQAIAASEAQRAEQIKRLEEALLGQMRELQNSQAATLGFAVVGAQVDWLKNQLQQFGERQNFLEAQQLTIGAIEGQISAKIEELEAQIKQPPAAVADVDVSALRAEMAELAQRLAQAEAAATRDPAPVDRCLLEEQMTSVVRQQIDTLRTQLSEQFQRDNSLASLETSLQQKLDAMQQEIREKAALLRLRDVELSDLRCQLASMAQRLDQMAATPPPVPSVNEREAERAQWQRDFDERLTTRLRELGDEIRGKLQGVTSAKVDQEQFRGETLALTARIAQLEEANKQVDSGAAADAREAYQATMVLRDEIAALKTVMLEQPVRPIDAIVRDVQEMLRPQIQDLHDQLGQKQRTTVEWENQFTELRGDIQMLMQRQIQSELVAKQSQTLLTQEMAQIRGGLKGDLLAVEAQLNERRSREAALQGLGETLNLRLGELHKQLAQGTLALDQHDGELRDLKGQVQLLAQQISQARQYASNRFDSMATGSAAPLGAGTLGSQPTDLQPTAPDRSADNPPNLFQPVATASSTPDQTKISAINLHDRLSSEIERKRAELREKSGRWKVRQ